MTISTPLLRLSSILASAVIDAALLTADGGQPLIDVADQKAVNRFCAALNKQNSDRIITVWSKLTIWQRLLIAEAARRCGDEQALTAVVGTLPVPGENLPKPRARPAPMF